MQFRVGGPEPQPETEIVGTDVRKTHGVRPRSPFRTGNPELQLQRADGTRPNEKIRNSNTSTCRPTSLTALDVSRNPELEHLYVSIMSFMSNQIETLDITQCPKITQLYAVDITSLKQLRMLRAHKEANILMSVPATTEIIYESGHFSAAGRQAGRRGTDFAPERRYGPPEHRTPRRRTNPHRKQRIPP